MNKKFITGLFSASFIASYGLFVLQNGGSFKVICFHTVPLVS